MPRVTLPAGGWLAAACALAGALWACSGGDDNLFSDTGSGGHPATGGSNVTGGASGTPGSGTGGGGSPSGGASGSSTTGGASGGTPPSGGTTGDGGAAADAGTDSGGTTMGGMAGTGLTSGAGGAGMGGNGGTSAMGGVGMGGAGAGTGGAGTGGAGTSGIGGGGTGGGGTGGCADNDDCASTQFCKKASCDATARGSCVPRGPECRGDDAAFEPVCGCDGITYWNTCVIQYEGFNAASMGECTGNNRPTCTRDEGGASCPTREHAHCYRPVAVCGDPSPTMGVCWVLPTECPANEAPIQRYCGGTAGSARCIGLCEVISAENSFRRNAPACVAN